MKVTQQDRILRYLKDNSSITSWEAIKEFGVTRLSAVIYNLKKKGYVFGEEWVSTVNRYEEPVTFKKYILL
jgi:hypothetical protein